MKILIEIETDEAGRAIRARVVSGGARRERKPRRLITEGACGDTAELQQVREFILHHGHDAASEKLGVSRAAIYQWLYRGVVPARHTDKINELMGTSHD